MREIKAGGSRPQERTRLALKAFELLRDVAKTNLFARVPREYRPVFRERLYRFNLSRFAVQSFIVALVDVLSLLVYLLCYALGLFPARGAHVAVHLAKILVMLLFFFLLSALSGKAVKVGSVPYRSVELVFLLAYVGLEIALFVSGPQDLGALVRFFAVPFIAGAVPVLPQYKTAPVLFGVYAFACVYLAAGTGYAGAIVMPAYLLNIWPVACLCAVFVSCLSYSAFVNDFKRDRREQGIQEELMRLNSRLDIIARKDKLTGLSNRRDFDQYMEITWEAARQTNAAATFFLLDIDNFKLFNERFGHAEGDERLRQVTNAVRECLTVSDNMFARYGSEEFAVVLYGGRHGEMVQLAEKMRRNVEALKIENPDSGTSPYLTVSIGVTTCAAGGQKDYTALFRLADECLALAKRTGRNRVVQYEAESGLFLDAGGGQLHLQKEEEPGRDAGHNLQQLDQAIREINLDCTFVYSRAHGTLEFSGYAQDLLGVPRVVVGPSLEKVLEMLPLVPGQNDVARSHIREAFDARRRKVEAELCFMREGERQWVSVRMLCLYDEDGRLSVASGSLFMVRNILAYSSYTYEQAMISTISLLPSRKRFYSDMDELLAAEHSAGCLILFDITGFKSINSIFSHTIGDKTLRKVGSLLEQMTAGEGKVYHYTTDQFILCTDNTSRSYIGGLVERIQRYFNTYDVTIEGLPIKIGFSVGAVRFAGGQAGLDELMVDLDIALQKAKLERGRAYWLFCEEDKADYMARVNLEKQLENAVLHDYQGLSIWYQPLFTARGQCVGAEALLRYTSPDGQDIPPLEVISLLERVDLIHRVGDWILRCACVQCRRWIDAGADASFYVHVNLSVRQLEQPGYAETVLQALEDTGLAPENLVLEVTESLFLTEVSSVVSGVNLMRGAGVRIAIDDFGTGYSSFGYLRSLPVDEIKIDKSFVAGIDHSEGARRILTSIVMLLKGMGFKLCVEGVEIEEEMRVLREMPVDLFQGYLFGRPLPAADFKRGWITPAG